MLSLQSSDTSAEHVIDAGSVARARVTLGRGRAASVLPVLAAVLAACTLVGPPGKGPQAPAPPPAPESPPFIPSVPPSGAPGFEMDAIGWFRADSTPVGGTNLRVGLLDGEVTARIEMPAQTRVPNGFDCCFIDVAGPRGGRVAYVAENGDADEIHVVSVADGEDRVVVEDAVFIEELELSADGTTVFYVRVDEQSRASVWSAPVDGGGPPEQLLGPAAAQPPVVLAARSQRLLHLLLSVQGGHLALMDCAAVCALRVIDLATRNFTRVQDLEFAPEVVGLTDAELIVTPVCFDESCRRQAFATDTGVPRPLPPASPWGRSTVVQGPERPTLLWETADSATGAFEVTAHDLETGETGAVYSSRGDLAQLRHLRDMAYGVDLPAGWFLVWPSAPGIGGTELEAPRALRIADGAAVQLTALGG